MWSLTSIKNLVTKLERHAEANVHIPWIVATGCCRYEIENAGAATYDWRRLGVLDVAASPAEADVLLVAGWINDSLAEELKRIYSEIQGARSVIAIGACAISGSPYAAGSEKIIRVTDVLPVDIFLPGCPPRPEALLDAVLSIQKKRRPSNERKDILYEALKGPG